MPSTEAATETRIAALIDTIVPPDEWPGGWEGGVRRLLDEHGHDFMAGPLVLLEAAADLVDAESQRGYGCGFGLLTPEHRSALIEELLVSVKEDGTPSAGSETMSAAISVAFQGFYGGTRAPAGWSMVGYTDVPDGVEPVDSAPSAGIASTALQEHYDVIVVGSGAGGGVAAAELTARGLHVLLVERAAPMRDRDIRGNHLQGKRTQLYDPLVGPRAGNPRVYEHEDGSTEIRPGEGNGFDWGLVAMALGGGTRVWQGMAWRFWAEDFRMASEYGAPEESTLVDWPFPYEELAPWYDRAEWELGVSGDALSVVGLATPRTRGYPMPPLPDDITRVTYTEAAGRLGWQTSPIPFSINSVPRDGRAACVRCAQCIGHACPVNAKNGTHNTFVPRAIATGRCDLLMSAQVLAIEHDGRGTATGVRMMVDTETRPQERRVRADRVVVSAGAVESPRLLLASGLGNSWIGRNHHSHGFAAAVTADAPNVKPWIGPGHSVATVDHMHHDHEAWGGGVLFDYPTPFPLDKAELGRDYADLPFGAPHKRWMREQHDVVGTMSMVQEVPHRLTRVGIDPTVRDRFGMPVVRVAGRPTQATRESVAYMADHCVEWVEAVGGRRIRRLEGLGSVVGSEHSAGTARMGVDPAFAACDPRGLLFGTTNVFVADASLHPTNGGFNPALTVMANAMRVASLLADGA